MSGDPVEIALAAVARHGAKAADAILVEGESREIRVRDREIDHVKQARERTLGIRAFVASPEGSRSAVTSTSDLSDAAIERLAAETVALAEATAPDPHAGLPDGGFAESLPELELLDPADRSVPLEERIEAARGAEAAARATDPRITNSEGSDASSRFARVRLGNSTGFVGEYESAHHGLFSMPIAAENGTMQSDYWFTRARTLSGLEAPESVGRRAADRVLRRLGSTRPTTTEVPVLFEPMTASSLLGHLAACVSGSAVYRKASFLGERLGDAIGSELLTVIDDGRRPGGLGTRPFDGEGLPTRRTKVLDGGVLRSFLLDTYSARKLGSESTGNAARGASGTPSAGPTNFWIEPGDSRLEDMIAETERGLLVTWLFGHGFNPVTGDFSRGAAGLWIEDGRISHPVDELTIAGNFGEMLSAVDAVGDDVLWLGSVAAPSLRIARLTVAGESA